MEFNLQPTLRGEHLTLRPLLPVDREALWEVARDPLIWEQHPDKTRCTPQGFGRFFDGLLAGGGALAVVDNGSGRIVGVTCFYDWEPGKREVAIGFTFLSRAVWGSAVNGEMKRLLIAHAAPHADTVWFHVAKMNLRSRRAMEKLGAVAAFEAQRPNHDEMIDYIYYRVDPARWLA